MVLFCWGWKGLVGGGIGALLLVLFTFHGRTVVTAITKNTPCF